MPLDTRKFAEHLRKQAASQSTGKCAYYVRLALEAGGGDTRGHPAEARLWGPTLLRMGFRELIVEDADKHKFLQGDAVVIQPYTNGRKEGHIAAFDGIVWISDFIQRDFWSGPGYRRHKPSHVFYRP